MEIFAFNFANDEILEYLNRNSIQFINNFEYQQPTVP